MKPIIFLDIEGIIITQYGLDDALKTKGETHDNDGLAYFCPQACEHVGRLIEHYDTDVVIISALRNRLKDVETSKKIFKERGLKWNIIDFTPSLKGASHGLEILKWMQNNYIPKKYLILDADEGINEYFTTQAITVEGLSGFADRKLYRKAMNILKKDADVIIKKVKETEKKLF